MTRESVDADPRCGRADAGQEGEWTVDRRSEPAAVPQARHRTTVRDPWTVDIQVDGDGDRVHATARLHGRGDNVLVGVGQADGGSVRTGEDVAAARALTDLARRLARSGSGDRPDGAAVVSEPRSAWPRLAETAGYLGGGLVLGGAALLVAGTWPELSRSVRIALLAGVSVALLLAATLLAGRPAGRVPRREVSVARSRLAGALFAVAAVPTGLTVATVADAHELFWACAAGLVVALVGYVSVHSLAALLTCSAASLITVDQVVGEVFDTGEFGRTVAFLLLGTFWTALAATAVLAHRRTAYAVGTIIAFLGAQQPLAVPGSAPWAYFLTFGLAMLWLAGHLWRRSSVLLAAAVVGVTVAVPEAIWDWTDGAIGGAVVALIAGAVLLASSTLSLRVRRGQGTGRPWSRPRPS